MFDRKTRKTWVVGIGSRLNLGVRLGVCTLLITLFACGGLGAGFGLDPNKPDAGFMDGAIPPQELLTSAPVNYYSADGRYQTSSSVPSQVMVMFDQSLAIELAEQFIKENGGEIVSKIPNANLYLAEITSGSESTFINKIKYSQGFMMAEPNHVLSQTKLSYIPKDFAQWTFEERKYLDLIKAPQGWEIVESLFKQDVAANRIHTCAFDFCFHNPKDDPNTQSDNPNMQYLDDMQNRLVFSNQPNERVCHGFHVSSMIAAAGDNQSKPMGINWYASILGIRIDNLYSLLYELLRIIISEGCEIVNISMGAGGVNGNGVAEAGEYDRYFTYFSSIRRCLDKITSKRKNFLVVSSAGNDNLRMDWPELKHPNHMIVGSYMELAQKAGYSNYGSFVDIYVPASQYGFPFFEGDGSVTNTVWLHGTSFAAPVVTGLLSLVWNMKTSLTAYELKDIVLSNSLPIGPDRILDMYASILYVKNLVMPSDPNQATTNQGNSSTESNTTQGGSTDSSSSSQNTGETSLDLTTSVAKVPATPMNLIARRQSSSGLTPSAATVPAAPTNLIASVQSSSSISISWTDNSTDEIGFKIERSLDGLAWSQIATVTSNVTSYLSTGLASRKTYYFRVRAGNLVGDSAYSNTAKATTLEAVPNPKAYSSYKTPDHTYGLFVLGNYAYVADGFSGLQIIDISNPQTPSLTGSYNTTGYARAVHVTGNYAYIADGESGLQIIDISNPALPSLVASFDTAGDSSGLFVGSKYVCLADGNEGIKVIDITTPASPVLTGSLNIGDFAANVKVEGKYAYVAATAGLVIVDVTDPTKPTIKSKLATSDSVYNLSINLTPVGTFASLANSYAGLVIVDVTNPATPTIKGSYVTSDEALAVAISGSYAYVATYAGTLEVVKISNPSAISLVSSVQFKDLVWDVVLAEVSEIEYVFLSTAYYGLNIVSK